MLLATALLGVLLWTVLGIVNEFGKIPAERKPPPESDEPQIELDAISNRFDLESFLNQKTTEAEARIESYSDWMLSQGFPDGYVFWNIAPPNIGDEYAARDNLSLISMAGAGDVNAMYVMAERRLRDDPLDALTWYDQAIATGSLYAMLKTSDLLETIADPQVQALFDSPEWQRALIALQDDTIAPLEKALAWSIAAVTVGGFNLVDHQHAGRLLRLTAAVDQNGVRRACEAAQTYVLDAAAAIRARGGTVFSVEQPPIALTVPAPENAIPCDISVRPLIDLSDCEAHDVLAPNPDTRKSLDLSVFATLRNR